MRRAPSFLIVRRRVRWLAMAGVFAATLGIAAPFAVPETEEEPVIDAASLVEPALLSGPGFSVDPHVELRGYMAHFKLDTRFGSFDAPSVEILAEREAELPALEQLDAATHSEAFTRAAGDRFASTGKSLAKIVMHPVDTITGIPSGVARFLRDRLVKLGNQAQSLSDRAARKLGSSGNPYPSDDGPMTDARAGDAEDAPPKKRKNWFTRVTSEGERFVKREIKYNTVKRDIAKRLGIDPYSSNPYVQERLSSLAWVGTAGNFSAGSALGAVGGVGADVLSKGGRVDEIVWRLSPDDLRARNETRLLAHCRDNLLVRQFLRRGAFSPTLQTAFADALDALQPGDGCDLFVELAITAQNELEARYIVNGLDLVRTHLGARAKRGRIVTIGAGFAYITTDDELVLPLAVDRLIWTNEVAAFLARSEFKVEKKTALIGGNASPLAKRGLAGDGWNVILRAPRKNAPPYADPEPGASGSDE